MEASQHVYVVKVRALPDPALLFPSERRYSALTVGGLAAGHAVLGAVALLLGALALSWDPPQGSWFGHLGAGLWLGAAALQASCCGVLAWRRWYEDRYIVWFFRSSMLAAVVAGAGLVLTSAALAHLYENVLSVSDLGHLGLGSLGHPEEHPLYAVHDHRGVGVAEGALGATEEGSGGGVGPSWLDLADLPLPDANSSTISSGGVFSDLVRDQDHDLVAADSTHHEDLVGVDHGQAEPENDSAGLASEGEPEWSVLRWVPLPLPPRASAQVRSLVAANVLVACFLELLWSLLGARLAWRGMQAADVDIAQAVPASAAATRAPVTSAGDAPVPILAALERGAADGKVDVDAEHPSDGELKKVSTEKEVAGDKGRAKKRRQQQQQEAAIPARQELHRERERRRRAPELPETEVSASPLPLPLSLEQRTMNLEERVARLLGAERTATEQTNGQA